MTFGQLIHTFFADDKLKIALVLVFIDFALGVTAAVKLGTFRLAYISDLARNDILFKLVPWFVVYAGAVVAGQQTILFNGLTIGTVAGSLYALVVAAVGASIGTSLLQLGLGKNLGATIKSVFAPENASPPKD